MNRPKAGFHLSLLTAILTLGALTAMLVGQNRKHAAGAAHLDKSVILVADGVSPAPAPPPPPRG